MSLFDRWRRIPEDVAGDAEPRDPQLTDLLARARALPSEAEPGRDLWSGIENRISAGRGALPVQRPGIGWLSVFPRPVLAASFASLLVVVTSLATLWLAGPPPATNGALEVRAIADRVRARDGVSEVRASLVAILERRRSELPVATVAALEENLAAIDSAIADIQLALEASPDNHALRFLLAETYRREAELLEHLEWWMQAPEEAHS